MNNFRYIKDNDIIWKKVRYLKKPLWADDETAKWSYEFYLNEPLASWDVFSYWEVERIESMEEHLTKDDILFDVGTEQGWCNLVYAKLVSPQNMVLIEPTKEFWGNIKRLWEKNYNVMPLGFYDGLFSDKTTDKRTNKATFRKWNKHAYNDMIDRNKYQYLHDNKDRNGKEIVPEMKLDDYVERSGITPTAITMDTEGSELLILKGAEKTLRENDIKLWVSIHDDLGLRDYGIKDTDTITYLEALDYKGEFLAKDHESHWYFRK